jgi:REP element-mobilizing transposase RayT
MPQPKLPQRKSPRLAGYTYTRPGVYFVTICTHQRQHLFGKVVDEKMHLTPLGEVARGHLEKLPGHFPNLSLDGFVVMPNHVHAICVLQDDPKCRARLGSVVGSYKAGVTINARRGLTEVPPKIWQGRYHDHIIRDAESLSRIREYVQNNPLRWHLDTFYSE